MKMQTEASGTLTWKAANCLDNGPGDDIARREAVLAAKMYCSDTCTKVVMDDIDAVGMYAIVSVLFWNLGNRE